MERQFSRGHLLISSIRNRLSGETARALMCLGVWSRSGLVHDDDINKVANMEEVAVKKVDSVL